MMYTLNDLLTKMGAPEAKEKGHLCWHYFDRTDDEAGGFAAVRLTEGGKYLIAEMGRSRTVEDGIGGESFYLCAERIGASQYRVAKIAFDGEEYPHPPKSVIELGLSVFHARALDISIRMVEQSFNKQDMLRPAVEDPPPFRLTALKRPKLPVKREGWGIVVPFRPRAAAAQHA